MADQFDKTITSINDVMSAVERPSLVRTQGIEKKRIDRKHDYNEEQGHGDNHSHHHAYSDLSLPPKELWDMLMEALKVFNQRRDILHSPYTIRLWSQSSALRVQVIHEESGSVLKQSRPILFADITVKDINEIINHLIGEKGIVIDTSR